MGAPQFYLLDGTTLASRVVFRMFNAYMVECPACGARIDLRNGIDKPHFKLDSEAQEYLKESWHTFKAEFRGKCEFDFYWTGDAVIVSQKFLDALSEIEAVGYTVRDIEFIGWYNQTGAKLLDKNANNYKELEITGRCGKMFHKNGTEVKNCEVCGKIAYETMEEVRGLGIDMERWDGSDICYYDNWIFSYPIVTEKVKNILSKRKLKGISFIKLENFKD